MSWMIIYLRQALPPVSRDLPKADGPPYAYLRSCFGWGLHVPSPLPVRRWALTPPFQPYSLKERAVYFCCTGLGVTSTGRYPASCPVKPGLSSAAPFRDLQPRSPVRLSLLFYCKIRRNATISSYYISLRNTCSGIRYARDRSEQRPAPAPARWK